MDKRQVIDMMGKVTKLSSLFLAAVLSIGLFSELRIAAFPKLEDGNSFSWFMFVSGNRPDWAGYVPENWRCRELSMQLSAAWCGLLRVPAIKSPSESKTEGDMRSMTWDIPLQEKCCAAFASYNAMFFFLTGVILIFALDNPLLAMLGIFASIVTSAPGLFSPYLMPWDLPTMAAWALIFAGYSRLKENPKLQWLWLALPIIVLGLLNETVLVTALFFIGAPWTWQKRLSVIVGTVVASQLLNWGLFDARPDWMFAASYGGESVSSHWRPLMLWPILLANAGGVALLPWLLWKRKDLALSVACGAFAALMLLTFLATGVYSENRDWLELAPIGWTLVGCISSGPRTGYQILNAEHRMTTGSR